MAIKALIFDMDGTLTDSNGIHAAAWQKSFEEQGFTVSIERINEEIGKGGDLFVTSVLGAEAEEKYGDKLREGHSKHVLAAMHQNTTRTFDGAEKLLEHARNAGLKTALATSSNVEHLEAIEKSSGVEWRKLFDVVVTSSDVETSKPAPDCLVVAVEKLGLAPEQCAFVGDTVYDVEASLQAGVTMLGVRTGPFPNTANERLIEAGARQTYRDTADLLSHFEDVMSLN